MEIKPGLIADAQALVTDLLVNKLSKSIKFHTLKHTQEVVAACEKLSSQQPLSEEDHLALIIAAWFHDTGYTSGHAKDHETVSIQLATEFLTARGASPEMIQKVTGCINATRIPQKPSTPIENIICDADLFHLGTADFKEKSRLLREEMKDFGGEDISKKEWRESNISFLETHRYFTDYGQKKLQPEAEKMLASLKEKKQEDKKDEKPPVEKKEKKNKDKPKLTPEAEKAAAEAKAQKARDSQLERGISTVFRIIAQNQNNLTGMADRKANIMISVNSIVLSIVISRISEFMKTNTNTNIAVLKYPVALLAVVCVTAIVFAILATRPNVSHGKFTHDDILNKRTNLLFFGNFHGMGLQDYDWAMQEMLKDRDYLYRSIVKDIYFLGVVLARKYRFLRISYNIFMYGLILTIIAFALALSLPVQDVY